MDDQQIIDHINALAREEHQLFDRESEGTVTAQERERLRGIEVTLDQAWDLLHQRRARRSAGLDPEEATVRDPETVEGYLG
jgi:vacuolar-type H+-ATPase subunit B/Vma2